MVADVGNRAIVVVDLDGSSNSTPSFPYIDDISTPLPIEGDRKRKLEVSSKVPDTKRTKNASSGKIDSVENISSSLTKEDVRRLFEYANISLADYEFLIPSKDQRANKPPQGYISVYAEQITAGLRFPLHDMVVRVCDLIKVSPSQLVPNAHRMIVGFIICAKFYKIPLTEGSFFSLFYVTYALVKGLFQFSPKQGKNFLDDKPSSNGPWKKKFFFLRRKGTTFNCITKWRETFLKPTSADCLAEVATKKGITDHHFRVNELTRKDILVHGGIEPGVPSTEITFRYLMYKAAVTKFELLPEDLPPEAEFPPTANNHATSTVDASSHSQLSAKQRVNHEPLVSRSSHTKLPYSSNMPVRKDSPASNNDDDDEIPLSFCFKNEGKTTKSPAQKSAMKSVNKERPLSSPSQTKVLSFTDMPIRKDLPDSSKDGILLKDRVCKKKEGQVLPTSDETCPSSLSPHVLAAWQTIGYVPRECYLKLEKDVKELTSELTFTKSRVQELEQKLELSEAKRAESETMTSWAMEVLKNIEKSVENLKLDSNRSCDKIMKETMQVSKFGPGGSSSHL